MKKAIASALLMVTPALVVHGQTTPTQNDENQRVEQEVRRLNAEEVEAFLHNDANTLANGRVEATKTEGSEKWLPLDRNLVDVLRRHREKMPDPLLQTGWVFVSPFTGVLDFAGKKLTFEVDQKYRSRSQEQQLHSLI